MIIQYPKSTCFDSQLDSVSKSIVRKFISAFKLEAEIYSKHNHDYALWNYYGERPMLSLLLQGLVRNASKHITALQEYAVYNDDNSFAGRADAFVNFERKVIYIESKFEQSSGKLNHWNNKLYGNYLKFIKKQANKYLKSKKEMEDLKKYYPNRAFLMLLVFHRILNKPINHCQAIDLHSNDVMIKNSFYTFFYHDWDKISQRNHPTHDKFKSGMEVYGTISRISKVKLL